MEIVKYKVYKEKPYLNSDRDPLGISINGKSKEYIHAHDNIKGLIKNGKQYSVDMTNLRILDVSNNKSLLNAIIEISEEKGTKGSRTKNLCSECAQKEGGHYRNEKNVRF